MDTRPKTRQVDRERKTPPGKRDARGKQFGIPMSQQQYDVIGLMPIGWSFIKQCARSAPELFPRASTKLFLRL